MSPEALQMIEKQDILKSDNIIMKEDINHLSELNQNLENEVAQSRENINSIAIRTSEINRRKFKA